MATAMARAWLLLLVVCVRGAQSQGETVESDTIAGYQHVRTSCDVEDCVMGGCLYERCTTPVACSGGLCVFRNCKKAVCGGGHCVFDSTDDGSCPGGACRFKNLASTVREGYCTGGACTLDGEPHPSSFSKVLSE